MSRHDDLTATLERQARLAPPGVGMLETVRLRASRRRRRRIAGSAIIAAVTAAGLAVAMPVVLDGAHDSAGLNSADRPAYRSTQQFTVAMATNDRWFALEYALDTSTQYINARIRGGDADRIGEIIVHDPGTFNRSALDRGQRTTFQGHDAWLLPPNGVTAMLPGSHTPRGPGGAASAMPPASAGPTALAWQDPSGAWVVVTVDKYGATLADVAELAALVRLGPPTDFRAPFSLGYLPGNVRLLHAYTRTASESESDVELSFGPAAAATPVAKPFSVPLSGFPLTIRALARADYFDGHVADLGPPTRIAGLDTWELTSSGKGWYVPNGTRVLVIQTATCMTIISADADAFPSSELVHMVEAAIFTSCTDRGGWLPPLR